MKFPNNIILDFENYKIYHTAQYWIYRYLLNYKKNLIEFDNICFHRKFFSQNKKKSINFMLKNNEKFTLNVNKNYEIIFKNKNLIKMLNKIFSFSYELKKPFPYSSHWSKEVYHFHNNKKTFNEISLIRIFRKFVYKNKSNKRFNNSLWSFFDINFLKKEKIYTKLKYSRVPQYDTVSGGVAAIFAGFLGFLICEKFGFELLDSGDFYFLFMYVVFISFFLRLFFKMMHNETKNWNPFSLKWFISFYLILVKIIFSKIN